MAEAAENKGVLYEFGQYVLDSEERVLLANGRPVHLPDKVFDTLLFLLQNSGRILTKDEMMKALWSESFVEESNLAKNISRLRKTLNTEDSQLIETLPRRGYRFLGDVRQIDGDTNLVVRRNLRVRIKHSIESENGQQNGAELNGGGTLVLNSASTAGRSRNWKFLLPAIIAGVMAVGGFVGYSVRSREVRAGGSQAGPVRLTDHPKHDNHPTWTKDGRIRFARYASGEPAESIIMDADGSDQTVVKDFPNFAYGRWSPDGKKVFFLKSNEKTGIYVADADGSNEVLLPDGGNHDWSADSKKIVYQAKTEAGDADIFIYSVESGETTNVTQAPSFDADPSLSPDGRQIVFASTRDGNAEIYLMNVDGTNVRRLTNHPAWDNHPVFSPDGTVIAFNSDREKEDSDIYLINTDGTGLRKLIDWPSDETVEPGGWSHDGTKIAFISYKDGNDDIYVTSAEVFRPQLLLADEEANLSFPSYSPDGRQIVYQAELPDKSGEIRTLDTGASIPVTVIATKSADLQPRFSPDGESIIHQNKLESNTEICMIRKHGSDLQNLSRDAGKDISPSFSPDGKQIAFASNRGENSGVSLLFTMNSDGSDAKPIYLTQGIGFSPVWSPDGTRIMFAYDKTGSGNFEVFAIRPGDVGSEVQLTFRPRFDGQPAFSPDGGKIAFTSSRDGNLEIYLMNSDGTGQVRVTRDVGDDTNPSFSPDGSKIIFSSNRSGRSALYEIDLGP